MSFNAVQPRGYGEHCISILAMLARSGSAPWIRGTLLFYLLYDLHLRFSPVDTGNTGVSAVISDGYPVQPRGYGEHSDPIGMSDRTSGSAPWIRGTHSIVKVFKSFKRFSPVDTGNTKPSRCFGL